ncbi:MAG TPA: tetratricopeptide repeat protein [Dongiaceae bacterium]|nr:tetratricopeptide repeat protein [Dongiaceae bacterium]
MIRIPANPAFGLPAAALALLAGLLLLAPRLPAAPDASPRADLMPDPETPAASVTPAATSPAPATATSTQDVLRAYLQVQEQLHATQLAVERSRQDAEDVAARNTLALAERLGQIEKSLGESRTNELQAMQASNHLMLVVAGILAAVGFAVMLLASFLQWRTMNRFTEVFSKAMTAPPAFALHHAEPQVLSDAPAGPNPQLLETISRLEKTIRAFEENRQLAAASAPAPTPATLSIESAASPATTAPTPIEKLPTQPNTVDDLLAKGQALLNRDDVEAAVKCFDQALALDPVHTEALIKKGAALEKISKLNEAIACYDRAIEVDKTVTIAYLYKGGVFNRMERYDEALACYEQALKTQEKVHAHAA